MEGGGGGRALKIQNLASIGGPDGLSAAAATLSPARSSSPRGIPRDTDNFTRCQEPSLFCVHPVSLFLRPHISFYTEGPPQRPTVLTGREEGFHGKYLMTLTADKWGKWGRHVLVNSAVGTFETIESLMSR